MKCYLTLFLLLFLFKAVENASFRCDYQFINAVNGWMKFHEIPATWDDAKLRCTLEGGILASPTNCKMRIAMLKMIKHKNLPRKQIFTGLHASVSKGAFYTIDGISLMEFDYTWAEGQPDNKNDSESCLTLNVDGELSDVGCLNTFPYICYKSNNPETEVNRCGTTDEGYTFYPETQRCYKFHIIPKHFSRANFACSAEGGHLAILKSEKDVKVVKDLFDKNPGSKITLGYKNYIALVGFHNWGELWIFRTVHGEPLGYATYAPDEPNNYPPGQHCGAIFRTTLLDDFFCNMEISFICEKKPNFPKVCSN